MKKIITNYRYWLLLILAIIAFMGTFSTPQEDLDMPTWLWVLVSTKAVGVACFYLMHVLIEHWRKHGTIPELTQFTKEF